MLHNQIVTTLTKLKLTSYRKTEHIMQEKDIQPDAHIVGTVQWPQEDRGQGLQAQHRWAEPP